MELFYNLLFGEHSYSDVCSNLCFLARQIVHNSLLITIFFSIFPIKHPCNIGTIVLLSSLLIGIAFTLTPYCIGYNVAGQHNFDS